MPEFPSRRASEYEWGVRDRATEFRAMPLRSILAIEREGKIAFLECGHRRAILAWLRVGDSMRCRGCFEDLMRKAEHLLDPLLDP